jgi:hypothetical protein
MCVNGGKVETSCVLLLLPLKVVIGVKLFAAGLLKEEVLLKCHQVSTVYISQSLVGCLFHYSQHQFHAIC